MGWSRTKVQAEGPSFDRSELDFRGRSNLTDLQRRQPVTGKGVQPRWWQRIRSLVLLPVLVVSLGIALAATIGLIMVVLLLALRGLGG